MQSYWIYRRRDNQQWDGRIEEQRCEIEDIENELSDIQPVAGSLHLVKAESLAGALTTVMSIEKIIRRMFDDVMQLGKEAAYRKWS